MSSTSQRRLSRRALVAAGASALGLAGLGLSGCTSPSGGGTGSGSTKPIVASFWGNPPIQKAFQGSLDAVTASDPSLTFDPSYFAIGDYFKKLAVRTAAGNPPDLIEMNSTNFADYAQRDVLLALDDLMPDPLKLDGVSDAVWTMARVNDRTYGVPMGSNSQIIMVDTTFVEAAGQPVPDPSWTWESFATWTTAVAKAAGAGKFGTEDLGGAAYVFQLWLRQRGKNLYAEEGPQLGFDAGDLQEWWSYWADLRKAGGAATPEAMAAQGGSGGGMGQSLMMTGKGATRFDYTNNYISAVGLTKDKLAMLTYPGDGDPATAGAYVKSGVTLCLAAKTADPKRVAKALYAMLTVPDSVKALGETNGVPALPESQKAELSRANDLTKQVIDLIGTIGKDFPAPPRLPPSGSATAETRLKDIYSEVSFGKTPIADGAAACVKDMQSKLKA